MGIEYTKTEQHQMPRDAGAFEAELTALRDMHRIMLAFGVEARERMLAYLEAALKGDDENST